MYNITPQIGHITLDEEDTTHGVKNGDILSPMLAIKRKAQDLMCTIILMKNVLREYSIFPMSRSVGKRTHPSP